MTEKIIIKVGYVVEIKGLLTHYRLYINNCSLIDEIKDLNIIRIFNEKGEIIWEK